MKKLKLVKTGIIIGTMLPTVLVGCNSIDASKYYLVHNDGNYYICTKGDKYINSCDYEYKSIIDGNIVGVVCSNNNSFDYQIHRLSTEFLSELQIAPISDVFDDNSFNYDELKELAQSDKINEIGDKYFKSKKFYYDYNSIPLEIYRTNDKNIVGYDLSPERLDGSCAYVYSIVDNDVINLSNYDVDMYDASSYFYGEDYITYDSALDLYEYKNLVKAIEK